MIKRLIRELHLEDGILYNIIDKRRIRLAQCKPKVEIYEYSTTMPVLGKGRIVERRKVNLILCDDMDFTRDVSIEYLKQISQFDIETEVQCEDGSFKPVIFYNVTPVELELGGTWQFEADILPDRLKELI